jgi:hypothetical protein
MTTESQNQLRLTERTFRGPTPFGWRRWTDGRTSPCGYEQAAIGVLKKLRAAGLGWSEIARHKDMTKYHPRGRPQWIMPSLRRGLGWRPETLRKIALREGVE